MTMVVVRISHVFPHASVPIVDIV